jgi:hypothetical protein
MLPSTTLVNPPDINPTTNGLRQTLSLHFPPFGPHCAVLCNALLEWSIEISTAEVVSSQGLPSWEEYEHLDITSRNLLVLQAIQAIAVAEGYVAAWVALAKLAPRLAINEGMLHDVVKGAQVYDHLRHGSKQRHTIPSLRMVISVDPDHDSLHEIAPKSIGGHLYALNSKYERVATTWLSTGDAGFPLLNPCIAFAWPATARKVITRRFLPDWDAMNLLGTLEFDLDRTEKIVPAFVGAFGIARCAVENDERVQGSATGALLNLDHQSFLREVQERWVASGSKCIGPGFRGHGGVSAEDWVATLISDNTYLAACGYEGDAAYKLSRTGMFGGVVLVHTYDLAYDLVTANIISSVLYSLAADLPFSMTVTFSTTVVDAVARGLKDSAKGEVVWVGDTMVAAGAWSPFSERYRAWERFVKYSRILSRASSNSVEAAQILKASRNIEVYVCEDWNFTTVNVENLWRAALEGETRVMPRAELLVPYPIFSEDVSPEVLDVPGVPLPQLCHHCQEAFEQAVASHRTDRIHAIPNIPPHIFECPAVARAAAIRRAALFAAGHSDSVCCDICAARIGKWADDVSYIVLMALMESDLKTTGKEWYLMCYAVWCVTMEPVAVNGVLTGFDAFAEVVCEEGAMGVRDVLDC